MQNHLQSKHAKDVVAYISDHFQQRNVQPDSLITRSWERSLLDYGLDPQGSQEVEILTSSEIRQQLEQHHNYLEIARNGMTGLSKRISQAGYAVVLTDETGLALDATLPEHMQDIWRNAGLQLGSRWSESTMGTNGIGTCLVERKSLVIHRHEHFFHDQNKLSCSVSPIFDPLGNLTGCLNASCLGFDGDKQHQYLTLQMVMMYSRMIENAYFKQAYRSQITMHIKPLSSFTDLAHEQLLAVNERGVVIGANRAAFSEYEAKLSPDQRLLGFAIHELTGMTLEELLENSHGGARTVRTQSPALNEELEISLRIPTTKTLAKTVTAPLEPGKTQRHKHPTLEQLAGADETVQQNVQHVRQVINKDIPILITGETGTGKEAFARAIHDASDRAEGPFIALNCAAIPESLIESELFGYRSGSFTGANRKGMKGKLELANGGTIFLDEVGDMPYQLQTRLLRALAEREILPLGATEPTRLDIQVISATHQHLSQRIQDKLFREDFYYRLNGMALRLPPLRDRTDKDEIIRCILDNELGGAEGVTFAPQALQVLHGYPWPGNIRQLANVLRYALAVSDQQHITLDSLPLELRGAAPALPQPNTPERSQPPGTLSELIGDEEGKRLLESLRRHKWNITQVSDELGICRSTVYRKMKKYNILHPNEIF